MYIHIKKNKIKIKYDHDKKSNNHNFTKKTIPQQYGILKYLHRSSA